MSIEYRVGNLLEQEDLTHMAHQANLYKTFGSGIARAIKEKFPRAYEADQRSVGVLGTWSVSDGTPTIFNLYTQKGISSVDRVTSYDHLDTTLRALERNLAVSQRPVRLGIPDHLGCGLAHGDWKIVLAMLQSIFETSNVQLVICKLPSAF